MTTTRSPSTLRLLVLLLVSTNACAFQPVGSPFSVSSTQLFMAKKKGNRSGKTKGFGDAPAPKKQPTKTASSKNFTPVATAPEPKPIEGAMAAPNTQFDTSRTEDRPGADDMNQGKILLDNMRREKAEERDVQLRRVKEIRDTDKMLQTTPEAAAIPEKVAMRMGKRMLPFVGIPLFGSLGAFVSFWYFATYKDVEYQPAAVAATTIVLLATGLLGITYSIVSSSWDEDEAGSLLGIEEFQKNVGNIKEGLDRSKENLLLREKMAGMPESEIERAIAELDKRDRKKQQSFQSMMEELD